MLRRSLHLACVCPAPPIGPCHAKRYLDHRLHQGQVLEVQEAEPLAKSLRFVLALHAETELCMQRPESGFETAQPPALREDSAACTAEELCVAAELTRGL